MPLTPELFKKNFCMICGSQRCEGIYSEWFNGCGYRDYIDKHQLSIFKRVEEHYWEALTTYFNKNNVVGIFLQGSQNYELETPNSDVDTKLIVTPTFRDIVLNRKPCSTTHVRENNEHTDFKDIRLYIETFRKQNLNFLEILFTPYKIVNPLYKEEWNRLVEKREEIARMNPWRAVKSMKGIALEKYHAMERRYPSKTEVIDTFGYDNKQLHHLLRVEEYLERYINGEKYEDCLRSRHPQALIWEKTHFRSLAEAQDRANTAKSHVEKLAEKFCNNCEDKENKEINELLQDVQYNIMKISIRQEIKI